MRAAFTINRTAKACLLLAAGILSGGMEATAGSIGNPVLIALRYAYYDYTGAGPNFKGITTTTNPMEEIGIFRFTHGEFPITHEGIDDAIAIYDVSGLSVDEPVTLRLWIEHAHTMSHGGGGGTHDTTRMGVSLSEGSLSPVFPSHAFGSEIEIPSDRNGRPLIPYIDLDVTSKVAELQAAGKQYLQAYMGSDQPPNGWNGGESLVILKLSIPEPSSLALSVAPLMGLALWLRKRHRARTA